MLAYLMETSEYGSLFSIPSCVLQAPHIPLGFPTQWQQSLGFACKEKTALVNRPEERLHTTSIPSGNHDLSV